MKTRDELIQDYIDRMPLGAEDRRAFDALWGADETFRADIRLRTEVQRSLSRRLAADADALRHNLLAAERRHRGRTAGSRVFTMAAWKKWAIPVAAAACLLVVGRLFLFAPAERYELPKMRSEVVRGDADGVTAVYEDAVKAFNNKEYASATAVLRQLSGREPDILQYRYYLGLSLMGERKFEDAAEQLLPLADGESIFRPEANYYLAVAYHELGRPKDAKTRLESIDRKAKVYERAQKLLKNLEI